MMERFAWQNVITTNIFLLKIAGLWPKHEYKFDLYTLYSIISVVFFITLHVLVQVIHIFFDYSDLKTLTEMIFICVAEVLGVLKIYNFVTRIEMLKHLVVLLESDIFQPKNSGQILLIQPAIRLWTLIFRTLLGAVFCSMTLWLMNPVLSGSAKKLKLPFSAWYPYEIKKLYVYELTYLHQAFGVVLLGISDFNIDMLISALMMYVGAQCDILCDTLRHLEDETGHFGKSLKTCVIHHKMILRFAKNSNEFFNLIMLAQFLTSAVCMALSLFRLALVTPASYEFYILVCSILSMIMQIFTYCWFGDEVEIKSYKILYAVFETAWLQHSSVKTDIIIFTQRALHPIRLSAFNLFYLSLETFVKILKSAVSYYTVLRQLDSPK